MHHHYDVCVQYLLYYDLSSSNSVMYKMATGYGSDGHKVPIFDLGWEAPAGQMYSTINDLLKVCNQQCFSGNTYTLCACI